MAKYGKCSCGVETDAKRNGSFTCPTCQLATFLDKEHQQRLARPSGFNFPGELSKKQLEYIVEKLQDIMYLERKPGKRGAALYFNPDKEVSGADLVHEVMALLYGANLHPKKKTRIG